MSWISDVRDQLKALDTSKKSLKKFGLTVGIVFLLLTVWFFWRDAGSIIAYVFGVVGIGLVGGGLLFPLQLRSVYTIWMGLAFALGWIVSRIILIILFYVVVTPIGLLARLLGKRFMDIDMKTARASYWIPKEHPEKIDYEKMY